MIARLVAAALVLAACTTPHAAAPMSNAPGAPEMVHFEFRSQAPAAIDVSLDGAVEVDPVTGHCLPLSAKGPMTSSGAMTGTGTLEVTEDEAPVP